MALDEVKSVWPTHFLRHNQRNNYDNEMDAVEVADRQQDDDDRRIPIVDTSFKVFSDTTTISNVRPQGSTQDEITIL